MDRIFEEWVGKDNVRKLYEIIAYCLLPSYPLHRIFCFIGGGMNGKSCFLNLLRKFVGCNNCCSTELDTLLKSRFEVTRLHKKLVCQMGETDFNEMSKTSILKKLTGGDLIGFEYKNKDPFEEENYAKILIATNNLPSTTDKTIGFYRRWVIIKFNNEFTEGKDIIKTIPIKEYGNLARMVVEILPELYETGKFVNEGTIEERKQNYIMNSNPLPFFLQKLCEIKEQGTGNYIKCNELYNAYVLFLNKNKKRKVSRQEFYSALEDEGIFKEKTTRDNDSTYFFINIKLKDNWRFLVEERIEKEFDNYDKNIIEKPKKIKMEEYTQEINKLNKIEVRDVLFHLDKFGVKQEMEIVQLKEDLDIDDKYIDYMLEKGYVFKPQPHLIKVL
jgi:putative DNA primase/helicase